MRVGIILFVCQLATGKKTAVKGKIPTIERINKSIAENRYTGSVQEGILQIRIYWRILGEEDNKRRILFLQQRGDLATRL